MLVACPRTATRALRILALWGWLRFYMQGHNLSDIGEHEFGSLSTSLKLSMVQGYLQSYATLMRSKGFKLWYIDAFAGTGEVTKRIAAEETLEGHIPETVERRKGSAQIAIDIDPPFDRLIFMEQKPKHVAALEVLKAKYPSRNIAVHQGDANDLLKLAHGWKGWKNTRAVVFLDPYGLQVDWVTLEALANTQAMDIWYLVSLSGLYRQATKDPSDICEVKRASLTRFLGTAAWEQAWYESKVQPTLFGDESVETTRTSDLSVLEAFVCDRFKTIFPRVKGPKRLYNDKGAPMFSLFFLMANPSQAAWNAAKPIVEHLLDAR